MTKEELELGLDPEPTDEDGDTTMEEILKEHYGN
jgi:hypothetical protein